MGILSCNTDKLLDSRNIFLVGILYKGRRKKPYSCGHARNFLTPPPDPYGNHRQNFSAKKNFPWYCDMPKECYGPVDYNYTIILNTVPEVGSFP